MKYSGNNKAKFAINAQSTASGTTFRLRPIVMAAAVVLAPVFSSVAFAGPGMVCLDGSAGGPGATCLDGSAPSYATYYANTTVSDGNGGVRGLKKFVDTLPKLNAGGANNFGEYIPTAVADTTTYPGSNYYIIGVVEHAQRMHSDLPKPTLLRSYVQLVPKVSERSVNFTMPTTATPLFYPNQDGTVSTNPINWPGTNEQVIGYDKPHYLGPIILTTKGTPVRVKMMNFLPTGKATLDAGGKVTARNGDIFLPVDESLPGAGNSNSSANVGATFPQNRVAIHLHGGDSPWISDGTPHQWFGAVGDSRNTDPVLARGDRQFNAPDMPDPGQGAETIFWPNDQSARLMWYHDHAFGLTRQNAYAGEAAGYLITDPAVDAALGVDALPMLPLILQDKTFVPANIAQQDAKWDQTAWGQPGDLWFPHVYEPAVIQDPNTSSLINNPAGRWDFGPTSGGAGTTYAPTGLTLPDGSYGHVSSTPESYMDTPVVNGVAYPTMTVEPRAYRVRMLNGANDRYWNLSLWQADPSVITSDGRTNTEIRTMQENAIYVTASGSGYSAATRVELYDNGTRIDSSKMTATATVTYDAVLQTNVVTAVTLSLVDPNYVPTAPTVNIVDDTGTGAAAIFGRPGGIPDPQFKGPAIIQFGNEAGLLPAPAIHQPGSMGFDPMLVETHGGLYLGGAERVDSVIDFSQYVGKTLILYNDSTAPIPAGDTRYDYYTNDPDQSAIGGAAATLPGFGPNTRTVMQFVVSSTMKDGSTIPAAYDPLGNGGPLANSLPAQYSATADTHIVSSKLGVDTTIDTTTNKITYLDDTGTKQTADMLVKTIEGGFDPNFGRLIANFGTELPQQTKATPLAYIDQATDIVEDGKVQFWRIKNNDADNHPIHFHLFNVQVIARIDQSTGAQTEPKDNEKGWKETVQNWPGQDVVVALKPKTPQLPFGLPNSVRLMDPTLNQGDQTNTSLPGSPYYAFLQFNLDKNHPTLTFGQPVVDMNPSSMTYGQPLLDANNQPIGPITNQTKDFGWEYVWHCHILGHEESDLMRPMVYKPTITAPAAPTSVQVANNNVITWIDTTPAGSVRGDTSNEIGFRVERSGANANSFSALTAVDKIPNSQAGVNTLANATTFTDKTAVAGMNYDYRVISVNAAGESTAVASANVPLATPTINTATYSSLTSTGVTAAITATTVGNAPIAVQYRAGSNAFTPVSSTSIGGLAPGAFYDFQVKATGSAPAFDSAWSPSTTLLMPAFLAAPTTLKAASAVTSTGVPSVALTWVNGSVGQSGYKVERCAGTATTCTATSTNWTSLTSTAAASGYTDNMPAANTNYVYRVTPLGNASNTVANTPAVVAPTVAVKAIVPLTLNAPTNLTAGTPATGAGTLLSWLDNSTNETAFQVYRTTNGGARTLVGTVTGTTKSGVTVSFTDPSALIGTNVYEVVAIATSGTTTSSSTAATVTYTPAPSTLTAVTTGTAAAPTVTLTWLDTTTNETQFVVERSTDGVTFAALPTVVTRTAAQGTSSNVKVSYIDAIPTTTTNGITTATLGTYTYRVMAVAGTTSTGYSNVASQTLGAATPVAPNAPAAATVVEVPTGLQISWKDMSNNETGFVITRTGVDAAGPVAPLTINVASTATQTTSTLSTRTYIDTTAVQGVTYTYTIAAVNAAGTSAAVPTNPISIKFVPATPGIPNVVINSATAVTISWADLSVNETSFLVERMDAAGTIVVLPAVAAKNSASATGTVSTTDTPVAGGTYQYRVTAVASTTSQSAASAWSAPVVMAAPAAPSTVTATQGASALSALVSWTDNSVNESGFTIQYATNATFTTGLVSVNVTGAHAGIADSYTVTGIKAAGTYYFRVRANNATFGNSAWSAVASAGVK